MTLQVNIHDDAGNLIDTITEGGLTSLSCTYAENQVGELIITVPYTTGDYAYLRHDMLLTLERDAGAGFYTEGERAWFVRDWELSKSGNIETLTMYAYDGNYLLDGRIVAYASGTANAEMTDYADDMMKAIVAQNLGASAGTGRVLTGYTVQADASAAPSVTKGFSHQNVFSVLQSLATASHEVGTYLVFDTIYTGAGAFEFRTYTGQRGANHGMTSDDRRIVTLDNVTLRQSHHGERNYVYCGGKGLGSARVEKTATNATWTGVSRWARRELYVDARNLDTDASVQTEADAALYENRPRIVVTGNVAETDGLRYAIDYNFGDIVAAEDGFGHVVDCHATAVVIQYNASGNPKEQLQLAVRGEL